MRSFFVLSCLLALSLALPFVGRILQGASDLPVIHESFKKALNTTELVFGGHLAQPGQFPMQALFLYFDSKDVFHSCGGTLISPNHVLTAAHCALNAVAPSNIMVGAVDRFNDTSNTEWREINATYAHPDYDAREVHNDIAVLEFATPVTLNPDVQLATLVSNDDSLLTDSSHGIVSGFGTYKFGIRNETITSEDLRYADVKIFSSRSCRRLRPRSNIVETQICAGAAGRGIGAGDSGGPLSVVSKHTTYQLGVASYGTPHRDTVQNHQDRMPSVFTRVSQFCDFIARVTNGDARCQTI